MLMLKLLLLLLPLAALAQSLLLLPLILLLLLLRTSFLHQTSAHTNSANKSSKKFNPLCSRCAKQQAT